MRKHTNSQQLPYIYFSRVVGWGLVITLAIYFIIRNAIPYFSVTPDVYETHWSHAGFLLAHIAGGIIALLVGPLQFWTGLRNWNMRIHRWIGLIYLGGVGLSVLSVSYIILIPEFGFGFSIGITGLAIAWATTTGLAFIAIRRRVIIQHKEWMIRSYVVTFGFVFFRLFSEGMLELRVASPQEIASAVSWLCWAPPLLITELILQGSKIFRRKNPPSKSAGR